MFGVACRAAWADAGVGRYAGDEESEVYRQLKQSPLGKIESLESVIAKTKVS